MTANLALVSVPFPTSSTPGARPGEGKGRLVNTYAFKDGDEIVYGAVPGLVAGAVVGSGPRGGLLVGNTLYWAVSGSLVSLTGLNGPATTVGALPGDDLITAARNNRQPTPDVVFVADGNAFTTDGTTVSDYPDPDLGSVNSVSFLNGSFYFTKGDGTIIASGLNSTDINTLATAKAEAKPDGLLRGIVKGRQFIALGPTSTEFWDDVGSTPFPLARSEVVDTGLFGSHAVAGFEDGWDKAWFMVASDGTVRRWDGYTPTPISTRAVERSIASVSNRNALTACVYTFGGNSVLSLSGPDWTWEYHVNVGEWFERESYGLSRWRAQTSVNAFGRWIVGDTLSDRLMAVSEPARREGDDPLVCVMEGYLATAPATARLGRLRLHFSTGQGREEGTDPIETDPKVLVSWSGNGGAAYSVPVARSLGRQGQYARVIGVTSLGRAKHQGLRLRLAISDPVSFAFKRADLPDVIVRRG
ncbi:hypothetical protein J2X36_002148 [Methylobacterium sp. BE186]|uniref:hypothetical protein n=1 Tax=Methylobacterium sp. BE186 TaxID=2817715 RepID=UPI0028548224|nr:hypothetical protein [Methylobacterium sp. BE186]MDR7037401.1 hypothetical protein [Methylobacterium sp. BE186]